MKNLSLPLLLFIFTFNLYAAIDKQDISEYSFSSDNKNIQKIVNSFEIIQVTGKEINVYVPTFKSVEFETLAPKAKLIHKSIYHEAKNESSQASGYRKFDQVVQTMKELAAKYPDKVMLGSYGQSAKGVPLYYLKVSDNVALDESEPELLITSATHGDEIITTESLLRFIETFLDESKTNTRLEKMIQDHEIFFVPVVNPDGFKRRRRYTADGTDPNREYPYPDKPNKKSVKCIDEEIKFFHSRKFVATIDLHAYGEMIMYPWGFTKDSIPAADKEAMHSLAESMARENKYKVGQISKVIYVAPASSADYFYWKNKTLSYGIELGRSKAPMSWNIKKVVKQTTEMLYTFIERF